jgi:predicted DNA-binding transcriptional regulator AlpA
VRSPTEPAPSDAVARAGIARRGSPYLNTAQAAHYVQLSERRLKQMRSDGNGPAYSRIGRTIRYHIDDLENWMRSRTHPAS